MNTHVKIPKHQEPTQRQKVRSNKTSKGENDPSDVVAREGPTFINRSTQSLEADPRSGNSMASSLTSTITEVDLPVCLKGKYASDEFFKRILEKPSEYKHFEQEQGLISLKTEGKVLLCIPDAKVNGRSTREIIITHAHSLLAHLGSRKTLLYLREFVWWPQMVSDVKRFCQSCPICATTKDNTQKPAGLLKSLSVPSRPWQSIGIDFVGPLPESKNRDGSFDMVCTVVDHLTSMIHLIPCKQTYRAVDTADVVFEHVYKNHGLPEIIVSDRDRLFTSTFWKRLHQLIGTELRLSSSYHPQTDGATERANRTLGQMLRQAIGPSQRDWVTKLPGIEFAMNSARSESTGFSLFFLNYGRIPRPLIWNTPGRDEYPGVRAMAFRVKEAIMQAHDAIITARVKQTRQANRK